MILCTFTEEINILLGARGGCVTVKNNKRNIIFILNCVLYVVHVVFLYIHFFNSNVNNEFTYSNYFKSLWRFFFIFITTIFLPVYLYSLMSFFFYIITV